jgi:hypothetical protein
MLNNKYFNYNNFNYEDLYNYRPDMKKPFQFNEMDLF